MEHTFRSVSASMRTVICGFCLGTLLGGAAAAGQPPSAPATVTNPASSPPLGPLSATVVAAIADAQTHVNEGSFADAVAVLTATLAPGLSAQDKQAIDFALADTHKAWGDDSYNKKVLADALRDHDAALAFNKGYPAREKQTADDLRSIGTDYFALAQFDKAVDYYCQALPIYRNRHDDTGEAMTLNNLAVISLRRRDYNQVVTYYGQALPIFRRLRDKVGEASALSDMGSSYARLGQFPRALASSQQALPVLRDLHDRHGEASALMDIGGTYIQMGDYARGEDYAKQARAIFRQLNDRQGEAKNLGSMAMSFDARGQYEKSISYFTQALPMFRMLNDVPDQGVVLVNLGSVYAHLGQYEMATSCYEQSLVPFRQIHHKIGEGSALMGLGAVNLQLKRYEKTADYLDQALPIFEEIKDVNDKARCLNDAGLAYLALNQNEKAASRFEQALSIFRAVKDRFGEAGALLDLGNASRRSSHYEQAIAYYQQSLPIYKQSRDRDGESEALANLQSAWSDHKNAHRNLPVAIFFGKAAVGVLQSIRADIRGLDKLVQKRYVASKDATYRRLAANLICEGRLPEALQILDLLKQEEYLNFSGSRLDNLSAHDLLSQPASLTPLENRQSAQFSNVLLRLVDDKNAREALEIGRQPDITETDSLAALTRRVVSDESNYRRIMDELPTDFGTSSVGHGGNSDAALADYLAATTNSSELQAALKTLGPRNVALYTLQDDHDLYVLLVTTNRLVAHVTNMVSSNEINEHITAFRALLQSPKSDPRLEGEKLYDLLIGPIQKDIDAAQAQTLLVSLDGNLRYMPIAALSPDGEHYLVEKYCTALYTPAAVANLRREPKPNWTALAMGVAKPPIGFTPLPAVPAELNAVVRTVGELGPRPGAFPGVRLLDSSFTKSAMVTQLEKNYPLVHIASHFVFSGDATTSFLLLGDGSHLTLADLKALPDAVFSGVNLLTLSACETATGSAEAMANPESSNSSRDVENVAVLAQHKGADAVLASLWSVNDDSTGELMRAFYRTRISGVSSARRRPSKAEALRQAQLALLLGKNPAGAPVKARRAATLEIGPTPAAPPKGSAAALVSAAPPFPRHLPVFAHPYFWAPFILIGNTK